MTEQQKATTADELVEFARTLIGEGDVDERARRYLYLRGIEDRIRATPQPSPQRDEESTAQEAAPDCLCGLTTIDPWCPRCTGLERWIEADTAGEGTPGGLEAVARWIEAGCFNADRASVRRVMAANVRQFK